jgi:cell division protease FtsH
MVPTQSPREYSEETAQVIDAEVKQILAEAHSKARDILLAHRVALEELAKLLLEKEVVDRPALQAILKVRSVDSLKEKKRTAEYNGGENPGASAEDE